MSRPAFIVTVDVEGDNLWSKPRAITTRNAGCLADFQTMCESFGVRPTYFTNYEMAEDPTYIAFGADAIKRNAGEIGLHLHAWNSPPIEPITTDDHSWQPYLIDYPVAAMREKVHFLTGLLEDTFQTKMLSHRAGRWAINQQYLDILMDEGYQSDSSITPHLYWRRSLGKERGNTVALDYRNANERPHLIKHSDKNSDLDILEVPFTVPKPNLLRRAISTLTVKLPSLLDSAIHKAVGHEYGLRVVTSDANLPLRALSYAAEANLPCAVMMLHSSELLAGGSPYFKTEEDIRRQREIMQTIFDQARQNFDFQTLSEYRQSTYSSL